MIGLEVDNGSFAKILEAVSDKICVPILKDIVFDMKTNIAESAEEFRGVSEVSIADYIATVSNPTIAAINRNSMYARITPLLSKDEAFRLNKLGYDENRFVYVSEIPGLKKWVEVKYQGNDKESILNGASALRIRGRNTSADALGSPARDFFKRGFDKTLQNINKYGII